MMAALTPFRTALLEAPVSGTITGSGAGAWGSWTGAATGSGAASGSADGAWGSWTGVAVGSGSINGSATGAWGGWTGVASTVVVGTSQFATRNAERRYGIRRAGR